MRSNSARAIVCLVALVESSTMKVDLVLRESTLALTATLPNSVITAFGIFSASSRSRAAVGFHSTVAAFTSCATAPPPGRASSTLHARACLPQRTVMYVLRCEIRGVYPGTTHSIAGGQRTFGQSPARPDRRAVAADGLARAGQHGEMPSPEGAKAAPGKVRKMQHLPAHGHGGGAFPAFGLDLWFKPLPAIRGWSRVRSLRAHLLYVAQRLPQVGEPGVLVLADQPHAPGQRVAAAAGHPGVHQRVEDAPLRLAEPGHHRDGKCGEHHLVGVTDDAPGHLAAEGALRLPGDLYPRVTGLLPEPAAAADGGRLRPGPGLPRRPLRGGGALRPAGLAPGRRHRRAGQVPDDRDLLPVDVDLRRTLEPVAGQPSGEPAPYLFGRAGRLTLLLGTHVIMLTRSVTPRNDFSPTAATSHCPQSPGRRAAQTRRPPACPSPGPMDAGFVPIEGTKPAYTPCLRAAAGSEGQRSSPGPAPGIRASGYPRGLPAAAAATAGDTATAPANPPPRSTGTTSTFSPGCGAWSIRPLPR